jgi:hypothetical protein
VKRYLICFALVSLQVAVAHADGPPGSTAVVVEKKKDDFVHYYGLGFDFTASDTSGLNAVGHNYSNSLAFYFEPTWRFGAKFFKNTWAKTLTLSGRFVVTQALSGLDEAGFSGDTNLKGPQGTCANITPSAQGGQVYVDSSFSYCNPAGANRRVDYGDIWLTLKAPRIYTIPKVDIAINPSIRLVLPSSLESQFQTLQAAITPVLGASRSFWKDRIQLSYSFGVTKYIQKYTTAQYVASATSQGGTQGSNPYDGITPTLTLPNFLSDPAYQSSSGGYNTNYSLLQYIDGTINFTDKLTFEVLYIIIDNHGYGRGGCVDNTAAGNVNTCTTGDTVAANSGSSLNRPGNHATQVFWVTLNYQALDWLSAYLALITASPMQNPDSTYRQGIWSSDYNAFTTVSAGATVTLDKLATYVRGRLEK